MKALRQGVLLAVSVFIGAIIGWSVAARQSSNWAQSFATADTLSRLGDALRELQALRKGDTNSAIGTIESHLDSEIITLSALASVEPDPKTRGAYIRALGRVRDYRIAHPHKSDSPEIDQSVASALASVREQTGK